MQATCFINDEILTLVAPNLYYYLLQCDCKKNIARNN